MLSLVLTCVLASAAQGGAAVVGLDSLAPGGGSRPLRISHDGTTVIGSAGGLGGIEAFRWRRGEGIRPVHPPAWNHESIAHDTTPDGSVVVGEGADEFGVSRAFVWHESTGRARILDALPGAGFSAARALHAGRGVIVGLAADSGGTVHTVRWGLDGGGPVDVFPPLPGTTVSPRLLREHDGALELLAAAVTPGVSWVPVHWREGAPPRRVPGLPTELGYVDAFDFARDGTLVANLLTPAGLNVALVRTPAGATYRLPTPPGLEAGAAGISDDGARICGLTWAGLAQRACLWERDPATAEYRYVDLAAHLNALGALGGWQLYSASDLSGDGVVITGIGGHPAFGFIHGWVATVPRP